MSDREADIESLMRSFAFSRKAAEQVVDLVNEDCEAVMQDLEASRP